MSLGPMEKVDWLCVNLDKHTKFDSEVLMRAHWQKCHSIKLTEEFVPFVVPDSTIEPAPVFYKPSVLGTKKDGGRARLIQAEAKPVSESQFELDNLLDQD